MTCAARRLSERPNERRTERGGLAVVAVATLQGKSQRPGTTIADVVSLDRKKSPTGLYALEEKSAVRPLKRHEMGKKLLARTEGLTDEQKSDLAEQNVEVVYVRETPLSDIHVKTSEAAYKDPDTTFNTVVVPYIMLNDVQAESVLNMASQLPEPVEEKPRVSQVAAVMAACWYGYAGM